MRPLYSLQQIRPKTANWLDRLAFAALFVLAFTFALEALHPVFVLRGWEFSNLETVQFIVFGLWIAARGLNLDWRRAPSSVVFAFGLWIVVLIASSIAAPDYRNSVIVFDSKILRGVLIAWITFDLSRSAERWQAVIRAFALGGIVVYLLGLVEAANFAPVVSMLEHMRGIPIRAGDLLRISSTLPYPTITAMVIELTLFPLLAWLLQARRLWLRFLLAISLVGGLAALALTFTRGALVGLIGGLGVMAILALQADRRRRQLVIVGGLGATGSLILLLGVLAIGHPALLLRFISENSDSWYRADFEAPDHLTARPGETVTIPVKLTNAGLHSWNAAGDKAFHLSYHILQVYPGWRLGILYEGQRTALPNDVPPGQSVSVEAAVPMPVEEGSYLVRWDMVQEDVTWFSTQNAPTSDTQVTLSGQRLTDDATFAIEYFDETQTHPTITRRVLWTAALKMVADHPWLGVGPDNFQHFYGRYASEAYQNANTHSNSLYVEWLADTGVLGLLAFLLLSIVVLYRTWRALKQHRSHPLWLWQLALVGSLTAWYLHGVVDYFFEFMPTNTAFWLLIGLSVSFVSILQNQSPPEEV